MKNIYDLKALFKTIEGFGYHYSAIDFFKSMALYSVVIAVLAYLHHLQFMWIAMLVLTIVALFPFMVMSQYNFLNEQNRFQQLCIYLKQMIINFKTHKKIYVALRETRNAFQESDQMYKDITAALAAIDKGESFRDALKMIEKDFYNSYVNQLHSYLVLGEEEGGDIVYDSLSHIDFQEWQTDTYSFQMQKDKNKKQSIIFSGMTLAMTLFVFKFFPDAIMNPLLALQEYQIYTFIYFEVILISFIFIRAFMTGKWIRPDE